MRSVSVCRSYRGFMVWGGGDLPSYHSVLGEEIAGDIGSGDGLENLDVSIFWRPIGGKIGRSGRIAAKV